MAWSSVVVCYVKLVFDAPSYVMLCGFQVFTKMFLGVSMIESCCEHFGKSLNGYVFFCFFVFFFGFTGCSWRVSFVRLNLVHGLFFVGFVGLFFATRSL